MENFLKFRVALVRGAAGGISNAVIAGLVTGIYAIVGHIIGFGTGPKDIEALAIYGFVVGCFCWGLRLGPKPAGFLAGTVSSLLITAVMIYISIYSDDHPNPVLLILHAVPIYGSSAGISAWIGGMLYTRAAPLFNVVLIEHPKLKPERYEI